MNASSWPMFLLRTLNGAEMAPGTAFKKVRPSPTAVEGRCRLAEHPLPPTAPQEPVRPSQNNFKPGMKLEAVDKKNPYLICPATIGEVKGEEVFIMFDGWRGAFDYWCKYDSRDIFPVGWCSLTKHSLQPPGNSGRCRPLGGSRALTTPLQRLQLISCLYKKNGDIIYPCLSCNGDLCCSPL